MSLNIRRSPHRETSRRLPLKPAKSQPHKIVSINKKCGHQFKITDSKKMKAPRQALSGRGRRGVWGFEGIEFGTYTGHRDEKQCNGHPGSVWRGLVNNPFRITIQKRSKRRRQR